MAFSRKHLGSGLLTTSETTIYSPAATNINGVIGKLSFYNEHTAQVTVTVYSPHSGTAASGDYLDKFTMNPGKSYICRAAINEVIPGGEKLSAVADVTNVINYSCSGGEE